MINTKIYSQAGFTLLEVLIALVIFSVGILGVGAMQISAIKGNSVADRLTAAANIASSQIEQFMSWDYDDAKFAADNDVTCTFSGGADIVADGCQDSDDGFYQAYWNVTDDSPTTDSKTIELTTRWVSRGQEKQLTLTTIVAIE